MLTLITAPPLFITWAEVDLHLKLDGSVAAQAVIEGYMAAACQALDGPQSRTGRALAPQTWQWSSGPCWWAERAEWPYFLRMPLPLRPLISVDEVTIDGVAVLEADQTVTGIGAHGGGFLELEAWGDLAVVEFSAGYPDIGEEEEAVSGVPAPLKAAALMLVHEMHYREHADGKIDQLVDRLIEPFLVKE
jgi:hypothetical protein